MLAGFAFDGKHVYNPLSFDFARWIRRYEVVMSLFSVITDMPPLLLSKLTSYNVFYVYYDDYIYFIQCTHNIGPLGEFCQISNWIEIILTNNAVLLCSMSWRDLRGRFLVLRRVPRLQLRGRIKCYWGSKNHFYSKNLINRTHKKSNKIHHKEHDTL